MRHKDNLRKRLIICGIALCLLMPATLRAQFEDRLYRTDYRLDSARTNELRVEVENLSFFQDNEYTGSIMKGYTLPGLWLQPRLTYQPLKNIRLELGIHTLIYHGSYKYPNYAYRDIAVWKGTQYQRGTHILPYFRAQVQLKRLNLVFGNLYRGSNHRLIEPLYSPELNLTADPEAGFQLLYDAPRFHLDAWINWESFIFRQDVHREAFTVGVSSEVKYNAPDAPVHLYTPIQVTIQHRGGEIDTIRTDAVSTLMNAGVGIGAKWHIRRPVLKQVFAEADIMGYYQQNGDIWPLEHGYGAHALAGVRLGENLQAKAGYFYGKDFISLFGLPYFGTASTTHPGAVFDHMHTAYFSADYSREFKKMFAVGAQFSLYYSLPGTLTYTDGSRTEEDGVANYSFGVYFRANLSFLIKKFGKK